MAEGSRRIIDPKLAEAVMQPIAIAHAELLTQAIQAIVQVLEMQQRQGVHQQ